MVLIYHDLSQESQFPHLCHQVERIILLVVMHLAITFDKHTGVQHGQIRVNELDGHCASLHS